MSFFSRVRSFFWGPYDGANPSRHRPSKAGVVTNPNDEDSAVQPFGRERLRLECRDLTRNNPHAASIRECFADNVVGSGLMPQAKTSDPAWNKKAEAYFNAWARICDYRQRLTLVDIQRLIVMARITDGEIGFVLLKNGQIQPVEAERIRTPIKYQADPLVVDGVRLNQNGIRLGYYIHNRDKNGHFTGDDYRYVLAQDFIHVVSPRRPDQVRGIPELAPVINDLKDIDTFHEATVQKAINESQRFYVIEGEGAPPISQQPRRYTTRDDQPPLQKVETGTIHYMKHGKIKEVGNLTPGQTFAPFMEFSLRRIGSAFRLPYEFVLMNFSRGSYSSSRAALLQTNRTFTVWQNWEIEIFLRRLWNWRIAVAIKNGDLDPAPVDEDGVSEWWKHQYTRPAFGWVDPQSEAQGKIAEINAGKSSLTEWCGESGRDAEDVLDEKDANMRYAIKKAQQINEKYPAAGVTWRDYMVTNLPGQIVAAPKEDEKPSQRGDDDED